MRGFPVEGPPIRSSRIVALQDKPERQRNVALPDVNPDGYHLPEDSEEGVLWTP